MQKICLLTRILRLLLGSPCPHCDSTNLSWQLTILPSNLQTLRCSRRVQMWFLQVHNPQPADLGTPCCGPCNTTASCPQTNQSANSQNHLRNCKGPLDRLVRVVQLASLDVASRKQALVAATWVLAAARWVLAAAL